MCSPWRCIFCVVSCGKCWKMEMVCWESVQEYDQVIENEDRKFARVLSNI